MAAIMKSRQSVCRKSFAPHTDRINIPYHGWDIGGSFSQLGVSFESLNDLTSIENSGLSLLYIGQLGLNRLLPRYR